MANKHLHMRMEVEGEGWKMGWGHIMGSFKCKAK